MSRTRTREHRAEPRRTKPNMAAVRRQRADQRRLQEPRRAPREGAQPCPA